MAKHFTKVQKRAYIAKMFIKPETLDERLFVWENDLFKKSRLMKLLNRRIKGCRKCVGMNMVAVTEAAPGWGDLNAEIFFIGQSLCTQCVQTLIPFTEQSGYLLDLVIRLCNLKRKDVFISNLVHCHPQKNRPSTKEEKRNCVEFLLKEIEIVCPKIIVGLGGDANNFLKKYNMRVRDSIHESAEIIHSYHPAYYLHMGGMGSEQWVFDLSCDIDKIRKKG